MHRWRNSSFEFSIVLWRCILTRVIVYQSFNVFIIFVIGIQKDILNRFRIEVLLFFILCCQNYLLFFVLLKTKFEDIIFIFFHTIHFLLKYFISNVLCFFCRFFKELFPSFVMFILNHIFKGFEVTFLV